ncbi:MAG: ribokinase [Chloroflexota bacterium]|nr:ribokinase [Chloroflexota bacterium]
MPARVVVVGSINLDLVVTTAALPERGQTVLGTDLQRFGGGKGANQALAAARMGAGVAMIGKVGQDEPGRALAGELLRAGIDISGIGRADAGPTGTALITVEASGTNTIVVVPGANARLTPEDVAARRDMLKGADALLLQLEVPMDTVVRAAALARDAGVPVFLNPSPVQPLPDGLLDGLDYLVLNEVEVEALTGGGSPLSLLDRGVRTVVLTLGERGAQVIGREGTREVPPFRIQAVDSTAAGDAFLGALVATLSERGLVEALVAASGAGALAASRMGAQPSLPTREEADAFVRALRFRRSRH